MYYNIFLFKIFLLFFYNIKTSANSSDTYLWSRSTKASSLSINIDNDPFDLSYFNEIKIILSKYNLTFDHFFKAVDRNYLTKEELDQTVSILNNLPYCNLIYFFMSQKYYPPNKEKLIEIFKKMKIDSKNFYYKKRLRKINMKKNKINSRDPFLMNHASLCSIFKFKSLEKSINNGNNNEKNNSFSSENNNSVVYRNKNNHNNGSFSNNQKKENIKIAFLNFLMFLNQISIDIDNDLKNDIICSLKSIKVELTHGIYNILKMYSYKMYNVEEVSFFNVTKKINFKFFDMENIKSCLIKNGSGKCISLTALDFILDCKNLQHLALEFCDFLNFSNKLRSLGELENLESLRISYKENIKNSVTGFPNLIIENLRSLKKLIVDDGFFEIVSLKNLNSIQSIIFKRCVILNCIQLKGSNKVDILELNEFRSNISKIGNIIEIFDPVELTIIDCPMLNEFPVEISKLTRLKKLTINFTGNKPVSLSTLINKNTFKYPSTIELIKIYHPSELMIQEMLKKWVLDLQVEQQVFIYINNELYYDSYNN